MRKLMLVATLVVGLVVGVWAYHRRYEAAPPNVTTASVTEGAIVQTVGATGTLEAVTTVQVGSQVSGVIKDLLVDFNARVRRGQVIARLDPSLFQTQVDQARANVASARAEIERLRVSLDDVRIRLARAQELSGRKLIAASELEALQAEARSAEAQVRSAEAKADQAVANLNQATVNLDHTVITAPIDGIVIARNVDVGQTVAATMQAPTLYVLAADLTKMQVRASIDESDIGQVAPGQPVRFRVDAYAGETFDGLVAQVRLQPVVTQNVVTYTTVIDVPNPTLKLKPGMTATVTVEVARRDDAVRIPNAALRFRPSADILAAIGAGPAAGRSAERATPGQRGPQGVSSEPSNGARARGETAPARVWVYDGMTASPTRVTLGISDGTSTELLDPAIQPGTLLVTNVTLGEATPSTSSILNPFGPQRRAGGGPPGVRNPTGSPTR
ncbi:MAG: efflux RND transporter periplasmic adaptor subunit [Vicinamibacterales bacterium]